MEIKIADKYYEIDDNIDTEDFIEELYELFIDLFPVPYAQIHETSIGVDYQDENNTKIIQPVTEEICLDMSKNLLLWICEDCGKKITYDTDEKLKHVFNHILEEHRYLLTTNVKPVSKNME